MALAPLTQTICQESRHAFGRWKFPADNRLRLTKSSPLSHLTTADCIKRQRSDMMPRVKANLVSIVLVTSLSLMVGLPQPNKKQPQRRFALPSGVKALKDLEYGKASGRAMLLDLGHSSWNTPRL